MDSKPHVCPKCDGERTVFVPESTGPKTCPVCVGAGVLWSPMPSVMPSVLPSVLDPIPLDDDQQVIHRIPFPGEPGYVTCGTDVRGSRYPTWSPGSSMRF